MNRSLIAVAVVALAGLCCLPFTFAQQSPNECELICWMFVKPQNAGCNGAYGMVNSNGQINGCTDSPSVAAESCQSYCAM